jgi:hypothetical protein
VCVCVCVCVGVCVCVCVYQSRSKKTEVMGITDPCVCVCVPVCVCGVCVVCVCMSVGGFVGFACSHLKTNKCGHTQVPKKKNMKGDLQKRWQIHAHDLAGSDLGVERKRNCDDLTRRRTQSAHRRQGTIPLQINPVSPERDCDDLTHDVDSCTHTRTRTHTHTHVHDRTHVRTYVRMPRLMHRHMHVHIHRHVHIGSECSSIFIRSLFMRKKNM